MTHSPSITQRVLVEQESGSEVLVSTHSWLALAKKSGRNDVPLSVLEQVYVRGYLDAKPHPKNSPEQQAFLRVESFLHQGKAYEMDRDLVEICAVPDGKKHMGIIKNAIKRHQQRNLKEWHADPTGMALGRALGSIFAGGRKRKIKKPKSEEEEARELAAKQDRQERVKTLAASLRSKPTQSAPAPRSEPTPKPAPVEAPAPKPVLAPAPEPKTQPAPTQSSHPSASRVSRLSRKMDVVQRQKLRVKNILSRYAAKKHAHTVHVNRQAGAAKASELLSPDFSRNPTKFRQKEKEEKLQSFRSRGSK